MKSLRILLAVAMCVRPALGEQMHFYVGTFTDNSASKGIYQGTLDILSGKLGPLTLAAPALDPAFLASDPSGNELYAVQEISGTGRVQSFERKPNGSLVPLNEQSSGGNGTCHVAVDPTGQDLLIANYGSGSIACFRLKQDGFLGIRTALIPFAGSGPNAKRQERPHAHSIYVSPDDAFVYACDLGTDHVWIFKFDAAAGTLVANVPPSASVPPGSGPRHLVFSPDGKLVYVANELGHSVSSFSRNPGTGSLTPLQTIATLSEGTPAGDVATAEIVIHPSGRWLYVSNRGCDTISVFVLDATGWLKLAQSISAGVKTPRSFALDPTGHWMITAGQTDNLLAVLKIDSDTGELTPTAQSAQVGSPVCILFESGRQAPLSEVKLRDGQ